MNHTLPAVNLGFESLKKFNEHQAEYWCARDLQLLLGYAQWRRFELAIERAKESCASSGNGAADHFAAAGKVIVAGKGAQQAGVQSRMFAVFHDAGYKGLYGGLGLGAIKRIGGVMPESIAPAEHIKAVEKRLKQSESQLPRIS